MLQKHQKKPKNSPKPQNPLVGITIFLFIYLLIKPVPQLVSGRGRRKKRGKRRQEHSGKLLKNAVIEKGEKSNERQAKSSTMKMKLFQTQKVNCNRKKRSQLLMQESRFYY